MHHLPWPLLHSPQYFQCHLSGYWLSLSDMKGRFLSFVCVQLPSELQLESWRLSYFDRTLDTYNSFFCVQGCNNLESSQKLICEPFSSNPHGVCKGEGKDHFH